MGTAGTVLSMAGQRYDKCLMVTETNPAKNGCDRRTVGHLMSAPWMGGEWQPGSCSFSGQQSPSLGRPPRQGVSAADRGQDSHKDIHRALEGKWRGHRKQ